MSVQKDLIFPLGFVGVALGSKVPDPCKYGHTQFHLMPEKLSRNRLTKLGIADQIEVFYRSNGITSLFAWTGAQAMYQGKEIGN